MIADVKLCRDILFRYADEDGYPSKIQLNNLLKLYSERSEEEVIFNVLALKDAGLLDARIELKIGADLHSLDSRQGDRGPYSSFGFRVCASCSERKIVENRAEKVWRCGHGRSAIKNVRCAHEYCVGVTGNMDMKIFRLSR